MTVDIHKNDFQSATGISSLQVLLIDFLSPMECSAESLQKAIDSAETSRAARAFLTGVQYAREVGEAMQNIREMRAAHDATTKPRW